MAWAMTIESIPPLTARRTFEWLVKKRFSSAKAFSRSVNWSSGFEARIVFT